MTRLISHRFVGDASHNPCDGPADTEDEPPKRLPLLVSTAEGSLRAEPGFVDAERNCLLHIGGGPNATGPPALSRLAPASGGLQSKRPAADPFPGAAEAASKPRSPADPSDYPPLRTQPTASTDDPLRRLPEAQEAAKQKTRARRGNVTHPGDAPAVPPESAVSKARSPYDPEPARRLQLDVLA